MEIESDQHRLTRLALRTLEEVKAQAEHGPVEHSWGVALALAHLNHIGLMKWWQSEAFWREMNATHPEQATEVYARGIRTSVLTGQLNRCYLELGWEIPDCIKRGKWAMRYRRAA